MFTQPMGPMMRRPGSTRGNYCWRGACWSEVFASSKCCTTANLGTHTRTTIRATATSAGKTDGPTAALLADLKQRGLLKDTLVIWGGEFGRTPMAEGKGWPGSS